MTVVLEPRLEETGHWDGPMIAALLAAMVVRPVCYTLIPMFLLLRPDISPPRTGWWLFNLWILFWEWSPMAVLWWAMRRGNRPWSEIGIDWRFFVRRRIILISVWTILVALAIAAPHFLYHGKTPAVSRSFFLLPVTGLERVCWLFLSASAGICEEIGYRGLPLRWFAKSKTQAWLFLPVTVVAFVFHHGWYGAKYPATYIAWALVFGAIFILFGRRRLEWLITFHALWDSVAAFAP